MYSNGSRGGGIRFRVKPDGGIGKVAVAGDFNHWKPLAMKKQKDGSFALTVKVPAGRHQYKYLMDNSWVEDPDVPEVAINQFGTLNSVLVVE